jgi:hypothetical protein
MSWAVQDRTRACRSRQSSHSRFGAREQTISHPGPCFSSRIAPSAAFDHVSPLVDDICGGTYQGLAPWLRPLPLHLVLLLVGVTMTGLRVLVISFASDMHKSILQQ